MASKYLNLALVTIIITGTMQQNCEMKQSHEHLLKLGSLAIKRCYKNSTSDGMLKRLALVGQPSVRWSSGNCAAELPVSCAGSTVLEDTGTDD